MKLNWAERWVVNNPTRVIQQRIEINAFYRMMQLKAGARVLEIGCGRGAGVALISEKFQPAIMHAMDLDFEMIKKAQKRNEKYNRVLAGTYVGDVLQLPYKDKTFDAVFGFGVLHHVPDWRGGLAEIARVLKTGGSYFFEELYPSLYQNFITRHILLHPAENRFKSEDWKDTLQELKLLVQRSVEQKKLGILGVAIKE
jgi:ubiquinone/menaquinone biosynthesis C-methylase UbiE